MATRPGTRPVHRGQTQPRPKAGIIERLLGAPPTPRQLFCRNYPAIREALTQFKDLGVLLLLFSRRGTLIGGHWIDAVPNKPHAAVVGRHDHCDLVVPARHADISLRHLVVLARARHVDEVSLRVIDLHTENGFSDPDGRPLRSIEAEGPVFLRLGSLTLAALVTGESAPIADDASDAFECIPTVVFVRERTTHPGARIRRRSGRDALTGCTRVLQRLPPLALGQLPALSDDQVGTLWLENRNGFSCRPLRATDVERGVLIGRYERCDVTAGAIVDNRLSRVHLLVVRDQGELFALDTCSSNGTRIKNRSISLVHFDPAHALVLADVVKVSWQRR